MRTLLVSMPFAELEQPALGLSLLQAGLVRRGTVCDVSYLNLRFAEDIGPEAYTRIVRLPFKTLAGDWIFSGALGGCDDPRRAGAYVDEVLTGDWGLSAADVDLVMEARAAAPAFLRRRLEDVAWGDYDVVGFTSYCAQTAASLAMVRLVKERHPGIRVVVGGPNWRGVMGRELHRRYPFVDLVIDGEADTSFPALVEWLGGRPGRTLGEIPGIVYRQGGRSRTTAAAEPILDLDALPFPDYSDYFTALRGGATSPRRPPQLLVETSRGCWWAARHPCRFCGLNGPTRRFRTKSPARILAELRSVAASGRCSLVDIVDNVISPRFLADVLPELADRPLPAPLYFQARPPLTVRQIRLAGAAGARIQPGIESLSDTVLRLMGKGTSALENVMFLKRCREHGVGVSWNLMYGFPGETDADYARMLALLPAIRHLDPPAAWGPVSLDRFSPWFRRPSRSGFRNARPMAAYRHVYPFPEQALRRIAYSFDYDGVASGLEGDLLVELARWRDDPRECGLDRHDRDGDTMTVRDTRDGGRPVTMDLDPVDTVVCRACDEPRDRLALAAYLEDRLGADRVADEETERRLDRLVNRRLLVTDGVRYLSLVPDAPSVG